MAPAQGWHAKSWSVPHFFVYVDSNFLCVNPFIAGISDFAVKFTSFLVSSNGPVQLVKANSLKTRAWHVGQNHRFIWEASWQAFCRFTLSSAQRDLKPFPYVEIFLISWPCILCLTFNTKEGRRVKLSFACRLFALKVPLLSMNFIRIDTSAFNYS